MSMTPKEALEHMKTSIDCGDDCPECDEAMDILEALVEGPTVQEVRAYVLQLRDNANNCHGIAKDPYHSGIKAILGIVLDFIDRKEAPKKEPINREGCDSCWYHIKECGGLAHGCSSQYRERTSWPGNDCPVARTDRKEA